MTFYTIVSIIGTFVTIAVAVAGLITYTQSHKPSRKQITQYSVVIGIVLVCVIILAIGIPYFSGLGGSSSQASRGASTSPLDTALNSSGAMFGYDAQHTHFNPYEHLLSPINVSRLKPYWTALTGDWVDSSPAVANGVVYVGSNDGKLYAFNANDGTVKWTASTGGAIDYSSPAVANGIVYIGSTDGKLYAFNASSGVTLLSISAGSNIDSSPAVANGVVYVGSEDNKLHTFHLLSTTS